MDFDLRNWELKVRRTYRAKGTGKPEQIPIQRVTITQPICVIKIINPLAKSTWYFAANYTAFINNIAVLNKRINLDEPTFVDIGKKASSYDLEFWFPWWHQQINLQIWQHPPDESDIITTLNRIEQKIDDISNYGG